MFKNILFVFCFSLFVAGCSPTEKLPQSEIDKFSVKGDEVFYEGKAVAQYESMEYEYYRGHFTLEYSMKQYEGGYNEMTEKIAKFLASKHPDAKIEVKVAKDIK